MLSGTGSPDAGPELRRWLRWTVESASTPVFVRTVAEASRMACSRDHVPLRPVLVELKRRHPAGLSLIPRV
jgi:hypothetical protein